MDMGADARKTQLSGHFLSKLDLKGIQVILLFYLLFHLFIRQNIYLLEQAVP